MIYSLPPNSPSPSRDGEGGFPENNPWNSGGCPPHWTTTGCYSNVFTATPSNTSHYHHLHTTPPETTTTTLSSSAISSIKPTNNIQNSPAMPVLDSVWTPLKREQEDLQLLLGHENPLLSSPCTWKAIVMDPTSPDPPPTLYNHHDFVDKTAPVAPSLTGTSPVVNTAAAAPPMMPTTAAIVGILLLSSSSSKQQEAPN